MSPFRFLVVLAALLTFSACQKSNDAPSIPSVSTAFSAQLVTPADAADLEQRIKAELTRRYTREYSNSIYWIIYGRGGGDVAITGSEPPQPGGSTTSGGGLDTSHSETNVQEAGVDEGDLVKTDGTYIYLARGTRFFVIRANPAAEMVLAGESIDLQEYISELYLSTDPNTGAGTVVTVISNYYGPMVNGGTAPYRPVTRVRCYDVTNITDPASPKLTAQFDIPGYQEGSRRVSDTIYLVTNHYVDIPSRVYPWDYLPQGSSYDRDAYLQASRQALTENLKRIEEAALDELLPPYTATLYTGVTSTATSSVAYGDIRIPESGNSADLSLVVSLDLSGPVPAVTGASGVMSSWGKVYMSLDSLYLASDNHWLWIEPMMDADSPPSNPEPSTAVHKFSVATGTPAYKGSAKVDGWVNDRFSMSDYQGYLRIGTTRGGWWGEGISNQLAVLGEGANGLVEVGKLTGIAQGERIYSMRFDRDRGYMVTFRVVDPLFTLDLSDPATPRVAGELTVNGFSTYIHLLDTESTGTTRRLLTIGPSANEFGQFTGGNKLQLVDVSNMAAPTVLDTKELGSGWSDALYDPHAFLFYEPMGILTVPYFSYSYLSSSYTYSSGLSVFDIGPASISPRGIISSPTVTGAYGDYSYSYNDTVDRSVIIGTNIYAVAHRSVTAAAAGPPISPITSVVLPESYGYYYPMPVGGGGVVPPAGGGGGMPMPLAPAVSHPVRNR